jgi:DNA-binding transcriptional MerR regulator
MNEPERYKTQEVCKLLDIPQSTLSKYNQDYSIEIDKEVQGGKTVYYYSIESVELLKQILELKKSGLNKYEIRKKLGIGETIIDSEIIYDDTTDQSQSNQNTSLVRVEGVLDKFLGKIDRLIDFSQDSQKLAEEVGHYKSMAIQKQSFIEHLQSNQELFINELKLNHEQIIKQLKDNHDKYVNKLQSELQQEKQDKEQKDKKIAELEAENNKLKGLVPFWNKKRI